MTTRARVAGRAFDRAACSESWTLDFPVFWATLSLSFAWSSFFYAALTFGITLPAACQSVSRSILQNVRSESTHWLPNSVFLLPPTTFLPSQILLAYSTRFVSRTEWGKDRSDQQDSKGIHWPTWWSPEIVSLPWLSVLPTEVLRGPGRRA